MGIVNISKNYNKNNNMFMTRLNTTCAFAAAALIPPSAQRVITEK